MRLPWPKAGDQRRAKVLKQKATTSGINSRSQAGNRTHFRFLNTAKRGFNLHEELVQTGDFRAHSNSRQFGSFLTFISRPMSTSWGSLKPNDQMLLSYYETVVSRFITSIGDDTICSASSTF